MSEQTDKLIRELTQYGLSLEEASLYLVLLTKGVQSALDLSRETKTARTKVYRILDKLVAAGVVAERLHERGKRFEAIEAGKLGLLIKERELELERVKAKHEELVAELSGIANAYEDGGAKVRYYEGVEGLKQVTWNSLKAKGELLTMEVSVMDAFFSHKYAEEMRLRFTERQIKVRTLTNLTKIEPWTEVAQEMVKNYWEIRHVPASKLKITSEILIYNDVYTLYRYLDRQVFCVEIYSKELAEMQRQIFEYVWRGAGEMRVLNERGAAELK
jgi:sugar-specific transcriptional regulator TrmB